MAEQGMVPGNGEPVMAKATAAAPSLAEGTVGFLSTDLVGNLRVLVGSISASMDATATAAAPSYTEGTANPVSQTLSGDLRTAVADGKNVVLGITTGAAVTTDANGTIQQYLRGLIKLIIAGIQTTFLASATGGYSFLNIAAGQATTVVKASAGTLHSITLNSAATATNTTIVYDHPSGVGTVIGRPNVVAATVPTTLIFDLAFANGLTIITANANGGDMTVCYK